ncbi:MULTISPECIES: hypothetical protein [unclassified Candidatus Tisiphia]|uniref:hypothetical protein n=1 Tax=unclassified Candidatus Tisiphia TaxID=2996318 RepID=UPI0035C903B4
MSKQQNYLFKKQDVVKAQKILTAVQAKNIQDIYTIVGLPSAIQEKLTGKTSIDAAKILTKQLPNLQKSCDKYQKEINSTKPKDPKLGTLCEKLDTEKQELEQVQKCLNLTHAINDTSVPIKQILTMSDVSCRVIEKLNLDRKYTTISEVVNELNGLLSEFDAPSLENDSDYASGDELLSRSTSETDNASSDAVFRSSKCTVKSLTTNTYQSGPQLSELVIKELHQKIQNPNAAPTDNHIDEVNAVGEHHDTH